MTENFEVQYDITKKSKFKKFYESNKVLIYSFTSIIVILFIIFNLYLDNKEKKKISLSENYVEAKIYLESGNKEEAIKILKDIIFTNDPTYSSLSLFLLVNQNLISIVLVGQTLHGGRSVECGAENRRRSVSRG